MILGPVSLVDCLAFCVFLAPQLIIHAGLVRTISTVINTLPFLVFKLPFQFIVERYWSTKRNESPFLRNSTVFEDFVIRCVRYAFRTLPADVGRVFFSKNVALPFARWRMLRHGYTKFPVFWKERTIQEGGIECKGLWIIQKPEQPPDMVVYYVHGGGFAMGSCFFYLEFLIAWHQLLVDAGYDNPAIFAIDYTLVPDDVYPRQVHETMAGYKHVLKTVTDSSRVCVAGDSAGGLLVLSLLLELGKQRQDQKKRGAKGNARGGFADLRPPHLDLPGMATLISPWITLVTNLHYPSQVDFLNRHTLWQYAHEYAGDAMLYQQPASPGMCTDDSLWKAASPQQGYFVIFGEEEVFAPDIETFVENQSRIGIKVRGQKFHGGLHAWPVASLFLSSTREKRLEGLEAMVKDIRNRIGNSKAVSSGKGGNKASRQIRSSK